MGHINIDPATRTMDWRASGHLSKPHRRRSVLHTRWAISRDVRKTFIGLHARTYSHATEDLEKVKSAFSNAVGDLELKIAKTVGHHGNPITVIEGETKDAKTISGFFERLSEDDLNSIIRTIDARTDEGCNLFLRIDKQAALNGIVRLTEGEDAVSVRIRVGAFPSRCEVAKDLVKTFVTEELVRRCDQSGQ